MSEAPTTATDALLEQAVKNASMDGKAYEGSERRAAERHPYTQSVQVVLFAGDGSLSAPISLEGRDLSGSGIGVTGRVMINPGREGAMRLIRSDGEAVIVGVRAVRCRYIGHMQHETGFRFMPLSAAITPQDFDPVARG